MAFRGWNDSWLHPEFRNFDITADVAGIDVPILALQGADDPYGTAAQLDVVQRHARAPLETALIPDARHSPHLEAKQATLDAIAGFVQARMPTPPRCHCEERCDEAISCVESREPLIRREIASSLRSSQ